ncbi:helix-turn-helix domain-containing protein [Streptomyces sp. NPDC059759]|uniref:helix-turn-helix domain-containing protein n=1 Tax=Streptomyces sp. NPDC059759 TaxID=3346936 RepID=UPI0036571831
MRHYLTTAEVADHYRTATSTVRYWRVIGYGPKCAKVGRQYLYPDTAVREFDDRLLAETSSDSAAPEVQSGATTGNDEATRGPAGSPLSSKSALR